MSNNNIGQVNLLWVQGAVPSLYIACILSMIRAGHRVNLFTYDRSNTNVPAEVSVFDADDVLPFDEFPVHAGTGSYSLGSNLFRYRLMRHGAGLWLDTDILLLKPVACDGGDLFALQDGHAVNGAVLYLTPQSPLLRELLDHTRHEYVIPPSLPLGKRLEYGYKKLIGRPVSVGRMRWGVWGPSLLTHVVYKHGDIANARPADVFYPVPLDYWFAPFLKPNVDGFLHERTVAIHLWNERYRDNRALIDDASFRNSFLYRFARQHLDYEIRIED